MESSKSGLCPICSNLIIRCFCGEGRRINDKNWRARVLAIKDLSRRDIRIAIPLIISKTKDENPEVRKEAVIALGFFKDKKSVRNLIETLNDESPEVREETIYSLGKIRHPDIIRPIFYALNELNKQVREAAKYVLQRIDYVQIIEPISKLLDEADLEKKIIIIKILGRTNNEKAVETLVNLAVFDSDATIRNASFDALCGFKDLRAIKVLLTILHDENEEVRCIVSEILGEIKDPYCLKQLMLLSIYEEDDEVRWVVADTLKRIIHEGITNKLIELLEDEDWRIRKMTCEMLSQIKSQSAIIPIFNVIIEDDNSQVQKSAKKTIFSFKTPECIKSFIKLLANKNPEYRLLSAEALTKRNWQSENIDEQILYYIAKEEWEDIKHLEIDNIQVLLQFLHDESTNVRSNIVLILGEFGGYRTIPNMLVLLDDENKEVRMNTIIALGNLRNRLVIKPLLEIMNKEDDQEVIELIKDVLDSLQI